MPQLDISCKHQGWSCLHSPRGRRGRLRHAGATANRKLNSTRTLSGGCARLRRVGPRSGIIGEDPQRDRVVNVNSYRRPALIRDERGLRLTTIEEINSIVSEHFVCTHPWIPELFSGRILRSVFSGGLAMLAVAFPSSTQRQLHTMRSSSSQLSDLQLYPTGKSS